jgi:hypothetical protein
MYFFYSILGIVGLNNIKANDYCNVILQVNTLFNSLVLEYDLRQLDSILEERLTNSIHLNTCFVENVTI